MQIPEHVLTLKNNSLSLGHAPRNYGQSPGTAPRNHSLAPRAYSGNINLDHGDTPRNIIHHFEYVLRDKYSRFPNYSQGEI